MADTTTTTYSLTKVEVGASSDTWGAKLNTNWDSVDDILDGTTPVTGIDINSGSIDGATIGAASASTGAFTTLSASGVATFSGSIDMSGISNASTVRSDLGLGTIATQAAASVNIDGGNIDGTIIGAVTPAAGSFTTVGGTTISATTSLKVDAANPAVLITETDGTSTHSQAFIGQNNDIFSLRTRSSSNVALSTDYTITKDATGGIEHGWRVADTETMRLDSTGLVLDDYDSSVNSGANGVFLDTTGTVSVQRTNLTSDSTVVYNFLRGTTATFVVTADGDVTNTNNSYGAISDIRLKENIEDAESEWSSIKGINLKTYNLKEDLDKKRQLGVIAQELLENGHGDLVTEHDDGYYSVKYSVLYMRAVRALQEAMTRIEALEAKLDV